MAKQILDDTMPREKRETLAKEAAAHATEVIRAMTADLPNDPKEEYRRIPWIWRVAIAAGRANDAKVLAGLIDLSLPKPGAKLRDWQAVALGGGVINGLSLEGAWPGRRVPVGDRSSCSPGSCAGFPPAPIILLAGAPAARIADSCRGVDGAGSRSRQPGG